MSPILILWLWTVPTYTVTAWLFWQYRKEAKLLEQSYGMHCDCLGDPERQADNIVFHEGNKWVALCFALFMSVYSVYTTYLVVVNTLH